MVTLTHGGCSRVHDFVAELLRNADKEFPDCPFTGMLRNAFHDEFSSALPGADVGACACAVREKSTVREKSAVRENGIGREHGGDVVLTARETAVLGLMADGLIAVAIARQLGISPRTVGKHVENIYRKFGTQDRASAVLRAHSLGLLQPR